MVYTHIPLSREILQQLDRDSTRQEPAGERYPPIQHAVSNAAKYFAGTTFAPFRREDFESEYDTLSPLV
jgi:hypothetical protein